MNVKQKEKKITILGIGNTLYQDEGVGVHILPLLEKAFAGDESIEVIEGATDGMMLLGPVEDTDYLIIIDAINAGKLGGTIITLDGDDIPAYYGIKMSVHQVGFQEVLWAAKLRGQYPKHIKMFGMQPTSMELGTELSVTNQQFLPQLVHIITEQVNEWKRAS